MPGRGRDLKCGLGRGFEQQVVDHRLVLVGDVCDRAWQRINDVEVWHRQQLGFALFQPFACSSTLTLRAMPVAAAVIGDDGMGTIFAACNMTAARRCAAALDRRHHLHLAEAHVAGVGAPPRRPVVAEDIRDLQSRTGHGRGPFRPAAAPWLSSSPSYAARPASRAGSGWRRSCPWPPACSAPSFRASRDRGAPE